MSHLFLSTIGFEMPTLSVDTQTPAYVLRQGGRHFGPRVAPESNEQCRVIYGFSDKAAYERFLSNCDLDLTPYPLVKGYLRNQVEESGNEHKLVAIDVTGPLAPTLAATTMAAVLEAQEKRMDRITTDYVLTFDEDSNAYQLENSPSPT